MPFLWIAVDDEPGAESLRGYIERNAIDVQETVLRFYIAFKRIKNFACVEFRPSSSKILVPGQIARDRDLLIINPDPLPLGPDLHREPMAGPA